MPRGLLLFMAPGHRFLPVGRVTSTFWLFYCCLSVNAHACLNSIFVFIPRGRFKSSSLLLEWLLFSYVDNYINDVCVFYGLWELSCYARYWSSLRFKGVYVQQSRFDLENLMWWSFKRNYFNHSKILDISSRQRCPSCPTMWNMGDHPSTQVIPKFEETMGVLTIWTREVRDLQTPVWNLVFPHVWKLVWNYRFWNPVPPWWGITIVESRVLIVERVPSCLTLPCYPPLRWRIRSLILMECAAQTMIKNRWVIRMHEIQWRWGTIIIKYIHEFY